MGDSLFYHAAVGHNGTLRTRSVSFVFSFRQLKTGVFIGLIAFPSAEGFLTSCTFDFMSDDQSTKFFIATMFFFMYVIPLSGILYYYSQIVGHVRKHEKTLREQARKMNATNLRANENPNDQAAEIRIAKVAIGLAMLFVFAWTPYACIALIATFGNR